MDESLGLFVSLVVPVAAALLLVTLAQRRKSHNHAPLALLALLCAGLLALNLVAPAGAARSDGFPVAQPSYTPLIPPTHVFPATLTPTATPSETLTRTATRTVTATRTGTGTPTATRTVTPTRTATPTRSSTNTPVPTRTTAPSRTPIPTRTPTNTPTLTLTRTATNTRTSTATPTATRTPTLTRTVTNTRTSTSTATATRTVTLTRTVTDTRTSTSTPTATRTSTLTRTVTSTRTSTSTATATRTVTPSRTPTNTRTSTSTTTATRTPTLTRTVTNTRTVTSTPTATRTVTLTRTVTNTRPPTNTRTITRTPTVTITRTSTPTPSATASYTPRPTATLGGPLTFTALVNLSAAGADLTKVGGIAYDWDAGAISVQRIRGDGTYLQATAAQVDTFIAFGLDYSDSGASWEDIDFGIYLAGGRVKVSESTDHGTIHGPFGSYHSGDTFAVAVQDGQVRYYHNSVLFYTSTEAPRFPLHFDSSFADPGAQLLNVHMVVGDPAAPPSPTATPPPGTPTVTPTPNQSVKSGVSADDTITCPLFPADNIWRQRVDALPTVPASNFFVATMGGATTLHAGFGSGTWQGQSIGLTYNVVAAAQPKVPILFNLFPAQSDPGPYPYRPDTLVQGATAANFAPTTGDRHASVLQSGSCLLYETWHAELQPDNSWVAANGAIWDMNSNDLRPAGWTSADAAGFAILPAIIRYDEVAAGEISHAIRVTGLRSTIRNSYVWPARHSDGQSSELAAPPMGTRFRLKGDYDISNFSPRVQVILTALKEYGMILADSGDAWQLGGAVDQRWDDAELHDLNYLKGSDFEVVDESSLMIDPNSGASR